MEEYIRKEKDKDCCVKIIINCDEESKCRKSHKEDDKCRKNYKEDDKSCVEIIINCDDDKCKKHCKDDDDKCCVKIIVNCDKDDKREDECKQMY